MNCRYCQSWNEEYEHRCRRCGRRLRPSTARPAPESYPINTATAPSLLGLRDPVARTEASPEHQPALQPVAWQRTLFPDTQRVVEMPALAPRLPQRAPSQTRPPRARRHADGQQHLLLDSEMPDQAAEAVIYCDVPVALPAHRAMAAALDLSVVMIGLGLFLLTFHLAGGEIVLTRQTVSLFGAVAALFAVFYHLLFCMAGGDTAGMKWTQLRLVNFDGQAPDREQRAFRILGGCLSFVAAGLGLIWALVDEESLTWHDHMSKTFPSPDRSE